MDESDILPCPFCGGEAERYDDHDTGSVNEGMSCITCKRCGASSAMHGDRKENLLASWNERCSQGGQADVRQDGLLSLREQFIEGKQDWRIVRIYPERCVVLQSFGADRIKAEEAFRAASHAPSEASSGVEPVAWGRPHVEYAAARGESRITYWVSRADGERIRDGIASPPPSASQVSCSPPENEP